jgi:TRAP-type uncharacterized transport system fused permease subunit
MIQIGTAPLLAHYFVFYFAVVRDAVPAGRRIGARGSEALRGPGFWETGMHAMKLAATTFIIPFAFVFNPELMAFPDISWRMVWAVVEVLLVQAMSSIFLYGYFRRSLSAAERFASFVVVMLGYTAIMRPEVLYTYLALGSMAALVGWIWVFPRASAHAPTSS